MHKRRNCEQKYPDSDFAKKGYTIGPILIRQCPKTYITTGSIELIDFYDRLQMLPISIPLHETPAWFVEFIKTVEYERSEIRKLNGQIDLSKKQARENVKN